MAMNARVTGCGELTLVLAHGFGGSQYVWDDVLPILTQRYRVVVFNWNFSGVVDHHPVVFDALKYSSLSAFSDDLISLAEEMDLKGCVFVGHSMSGMIGCIASVKRPDLFSHLVLVGASPRYMNAEGYEGGFKKIEIDSILANIESNFQTWAVAFTSLVVGQHESASVEDFKMNFRRMRPEIALSVARTIFLSDERDVLEKVKVPCTIVQCTNDIVVPNSVAYYMHSKIKGPASLEFIDADGHFPQLTAHRLLIDVLDRALLPNALQ